MVSRTLRTEQQVFMFTTRDPNNATWRHRGLCFCSLISLRQDRKVMVLFLLQISINSTSTSPIPIPTAQFKSPNGNLDLLTTKFMSTSTQRRKPVRLEHGKGSFSAQFSWAASEKEYDQWSIAGSNSESWKPKIGWILHKRNLIQLIHTPWAWCGFLSIASRICP